MRSLNTVALAVHGSLNTYGILYRAGRLTPKEIAEVRAAKEKYTVVMQAAIYAADFNTAAPAGSQVEDAAAVLINLIATFN